MRRGFLILLLALPGQAVAEDCADADGQLERANCLSEALEEVDTELNAIWPSVLTEHPSGGDFDEHTELIRAAQRAWVRFRDADCAAASRIGIPSYWGLNELRCKIDHTRARIGALRETYLH